MKEIYAIIDDSKDVVAEIQETDVKNGFSESENELEIW